MRFNLIFILIFISSAGYANLSFELCQEIALGIVASTSGKDISKDIRIKRLDLWKEYESAYIGSEGYDFMLADMLISLGKQVEGTNLFLQTAQAYEKATGESILYYEEVS